MSLSCKCAYVNNDLKTARRGRLMAKGDCNRVRDVSPKYSSPPAQGRI